MLFTNVWNRLMRRPAARRRQKGHQTPGFRRRWVLPRIETLEQRTVLSTWTVTSPADSGDGSLRALIDAAQDGDQIVFDHSLSGQMITLTSGELAITKSLDIEGLGADQLAIGGNHASRIFNISGGVTVTIAGLAMRGGRVVGTTGGGGILNDGSTLILAHDVLSNNQAIGTPTTVNLSGGAIVNTSAATLIITDSSFTDNQVLAAPGGNVVGGGAIVNSLSSSLVVSYSTFVGNQAGAGTGTVSIGGAISSGGAGSSATISHCTFIANQSHPGDGGVQSPTRPNVGNAQGGALGSSGGANLYLDSSIFTANQAIGGNGGTGTSGTSEFGIDGAVGGAIQNEGALGMLTVISGCAFIGNQAIGGTSAMGGTSGPGLIASALGGAIHVNNGVTAVLTNTRFIHNEALGGNGNTGDASHDLSVGAGWGGAILVGPQTAK